jgi:NDP-sugar pyrophosphorylase family protein
VQCVVLAGGLATRMRPATEAIPKYLLPVAGAPFADHQLAWLARQGVDDVVLCVAHLGAEIKAYVGDGARWGLRIRYVDEGSELRGTAGALRLAVDQGVLDPAFLVLYGDSYLQVDVAAVWKAFMSSSTRALMTVYENDGRWERSNVRFEAGVVELYDKSVADPGACGVHHVDYGLLVFHRDAIEDLVAPESSSDLADLQHRLSLRGELLGVEVFERFFEIGSIEGLRELEAHLCTPGR